MSDRGPASMQSELLGAYHHLAPVQLGQQVIQVVRYQVNDAFLQGLLFGSHQALAHRFLGPLSGFLAPPLGKVLGLPGQGVDQLLLHGLGQLLALSRNGGCSPDGGLGSHGCHMSGQGNVSAG